MMAEPMGRVWSSSGTYKWVPDVVREATAKEKSDRMNVFLPAPQDGGTLPKLLSDPHRSGTISSGGHGLSRNAPTRTALATLKPLAYLNESVELEWSEPAKVLLELMTDDLETYGADTHRANADPTHRPTRTPD